jgi:hypothetical protein
MDLDNEAVRAVGGPPAEATELTGEERVVATRKAAIAEIPTVSFRDLSAIDVMGPTQRVSKNWAHHELSSTSGSTEEAIEHVVQKSVRAEACDQPDY